MRGRFGPPIRSTAASRITGKSDDAAPTRPEGRNVRFASNTGRRGQAVRTGASHSRLLQSCHSAFGPPKSWLLGAHLRMVPASAVVLESGRHVGSRFRLPWVESGSSRHDGGSTGNDPYLTSRDGLARPSRIFRSSSWLCDLSFKDEQVALRGLRCKQPGFLISRILVAGFGHLV
jgi:hypothetical protein